MEAGAHAEGRGTAVAGMTAHDFREGARTGTGWRGILVAPSRMVITISVQYTHAPVTLLQRHAGCVHPGAAGGQHVRIHTEGNAHMSRCAKG